MLLYLFAAGYAYADNRDITLKVRPHICIVDKRSPTCDMTFKVQWRSPTKGNYCLRIGVEAPLSCWADDDAGEHEVFRVVDTAFSFRLADADTDATVAEVRVEVMNADSTDRRRQRRRRHVWSVL